jgi:heterodisulfide reductase subunit A
MNKEKNVVIIGGGPAGMEAAAKLAGFGHQVTIVEKEEQTGGNLKRWHNLFPDFTSSKVVKDYLKSGIQKSGANVLVQSEAVRIDREKDNQLVILKNGKSLKADAVVLATGFQPFDARRKEEYGYKIYDNVITSVDLEQMFTSGAIVTSSGKIPQRIAFIHCVGSRDKKSGNLYCSKVCCVTGVKQAIELKKEIQEAKIYNFYMDLRMYGQDFEELYIEAQQKWGITFIRGRVSEIAQNIDGSLQLKAEDTLVGRPIRMNFDLVVLLVGMVPSSGSEALGKSASVNFTGGNFFRSVERPIKMNETEAPGIFITGTCREPLSIQETLADATAVSMKVNDYLSGEEKV